MAFILKNYSGFRKIADGGMSEIFRAVNRVSRRTVVIKKMSIDPANRAFLLQQYENEAKNATLLSHPNIITILDYGEYNGSFFIVMEYIEGYNLDQLMSSKSFNSEIGLMIVFTALQALLFAHKNGVIHCDIKPANILVGKSGRVILTDFGLSRAKAHAMDLEKKRYDFTTPLYMPPEQAKIIAEKVGLANDRWEETATVVYSDMSPEQARMLNERGVQWDLWSVGVLLFRMCSGRYPFKGNDLAGLLTSIVHAETAGIHDLVAGFSKPIASAIEKCLEKEPYRRPNSIDTVIDALKKHFVSVDIGTIQGMIASHVKQIMAKKGIWHVISIRSSFVAIIEKTIRSLRKRVSGLSGRFTTVRSAMLPGQDIQGNGPGKRFSRFRIMVPFGLKSRYAKPAIALAVIVFLVIFGILTHNSGHQIKKLATVAAVKYSKTEIKKIPPPAIKSDKQKRVEKPIAALKLKTAPKPRSTVPSQGPPSKAVASTAPTAQKAIVKLPAARIRGKKTPVAKKSRSLAKAPSSRGILKFSIDPNDARVFIDGEMITRREMANGRSVAAGFHDIVAQSPGFEPHQQSFLIEKNKTQLLAIALKKIELGNGQLHVYSYPWSNLYLDDVLIGTAPTPSPIILQEGSHQVVLKRDGFEIHLETVRIVKDEVTRIQVQLEKTAFEE
jgi:serine/threonine protein kinase